MKLKSLNKKGMIGGIIIGIALLGVIIFAVVIPIKDRWKDLNTLTTNFTPIQKDFSDTFPFLAEDLQIIAAPDGTSTCNEVIDTTTNQPKNPREWVCASQSKIHFNSSVTYYGTKLRNMRAGVVICKDDMDNCCSTTYDAMYINKYVDFVWSLKKVDIIPNDKMIVNSGIYAIGKDLLADGTYKIHPMTECTFDSKTGCKVTGMTQSAKSCNSNNYILVKIGN